MLQLLVARKRSPLHTPVGKGNGEITELLLRKGANVDARGRRRTTSLCIATERGYLEIVKHLLKRRADVNSAYTFITRHDYVPLHVKNGSQEIIKWLLSKRADVNAEAENGLTCLRIVLQGREFQIAEHLLKYGADVNSAYTSTFLEGYTSPHLAAEKGDEEITVSLLSKGANVHAEGDTGITSLRIATERGYLEIVKHLLKHAADVNSACTSATRHGYTPLRLAVEKADEQITELLFLSKRANVNAKGKHGTTSLRLAAQWEHLRIVEYPSKRGANDDSSSAGVHTPLYVASLGLGIGMQIILCILLLRMDIWNLSKNS